MEKNDDDNDDDVYYCLRWFFSVAVESECVLLVHWQDGNLSRKKLHSINGRYGNLGWSLRAICGV
jgi:hypothetical protein